MTSIFESKRVEHYAHRHALELVVHELHGGHPLNRDAAREHVERKLASNEDLLRKVVAEMRAEQMVDAVVDGADIDSQEVLDKAIEQAAKKGLNGFFRDAESGELYLPAFQLKAMLKEAACIAANSGLIEGGKQWGEGNLKKGLKGWFPEHVFVVEDRIMLGRTDADDISQRFMQGGRFGPAIVLEEYILDAKVACTVVSDYPIKDKDWEAILMTGEQNGLGASRSQGFGTFDVTKWEKL